MPNLAQTIKSEIARISKKQIKLSVSPLQKTLSKLRSDNSELKKKVAEIEKIVKKLSPRMESKVGKVADEEKIKKARIAPKTIRTLRKKLTLSQRDLAKLLGVSSQSVTQWENKKGTLNLRPQTIGAVLMVKKMGKRDVKKRLNGGE